MRQISERAEPGIRAAETLTLPFGVRQKSRFRASLDSGEEVAVILPRGGVLRDGDLLRAQDGSVVKVAAAVELVSQVRSEDPLLLMRAAYHLGNRHVPLQVERERLAYLHDHVLDSMLREMGLVVESLELPFEPEAGAYHSHGGHGHSHAHDGDHQH